jgi:hypothetical protein
MSMKGKTLLKGHTLLHEGALSTGRRGPGSAMCSCGWTMFCASDNDRKKEHRKHKEAIREHMSAESEVL